MSESQPRAKEVEERQVVKVRSAVDLDGEYFREGDKNRPCAIYQRGKVLLLVNEQGSLATGEVVGPKDIVVIQGNGWLPGLRAVIQEEGKTIDWRNGSIWSR